MSHDRDAADRERPPAPGEEALPPNAGVDLHRLRELFQSVAAPEPDEAVWSAVLARVHDGIAASPVRRTEPRVGAASRAAQRRGWAVAGLAAAAALLAVLLFRFWAAPPTPQPMPAEEPYPVAEADDVEILAIDARDVAGLVVGEPPVSGELIFASLEDVRVIECKCCPKSGNMAKLEPGEVPMLVTSLARVDTPNDE